MRILIGLLVVGVVIGGIVTRRQREEKAPPAPAVSVSAAQPAAPRQPGEHNWAKNALDRAGEVKRQVAEKKKQDEEN